MSKKILVTGASGFLGESLRESLLKLGCSVILTDVKKDNNVLYCDLMDDGCSIRNIISEHDPDIVIHAAAVVPKNMLEYDNEDIFQNNQHMLKNLIQASPRAICFVSSMTVYGSVSNRKVCEDGELMPESQYAKSKVLSETELKLSGIPGYRIRIPGLYGGNRKSGLVHNAFHSALCKAQLELPEKPLVWSAMHVDDASNYIANLVMQESRDCAPINIAYSGPASVNILVDFLRENYFPGIEYLVQHPSFEFNLAKFERVTGIKPLSFNKALKALHEIW